MKLKQYHDLKSQANSLRKRASELEQKAIEAAQAALGLVPDETIVSYDGKEFLFYDIKNIFTENSVWIEVKKKKKDGTFGGATKTIYKDWAIVGKETE